DDERDSIILVCFGLWSRLNRQLRECARDSVGSRREEDMVMLQTKIDVELECGVPRILGLDGDEEGLIHAPLIERPLSARVIEALLASAAGVALRPLDRQG